MVVRVSLHEAVGTGLIIKAKTGIVWTNQAGGVSCLQPECEGLYVPFGNDVSLDGRLISLESALFELFRGEVGGMSFAEVGWARSFELALKRYAAEHWRPFAEIELDRARLGESVEAWVHVIYRPMQFHVPFEGLGEPPFEAVLTWTNSD
jgi:hypothetical protein